MKLAVALSMGLMLVPTLSFAEPSQSALPAGKPAGIRQAQNVDNTTLYVVGGAAIVGIIIAVAASGDGDSATNTAPPVPTQH